MEMLFLNVLKVEKVFPKKMPPTANGIVRECMAAQVKTEGGSNVIFIADGVDVPVGWSGKALCLATSVTNTRVFNGSGSSNTTYNPILIQKFSPIAKVEEESVLNDFMSAFAAPVIHSNDSSAPKVSPSEGNKGISQR